MQLEEREGRNQSKHHHFPCYMEDTPGNGLTPLWRLTSLKTSSQQAGNSGEPVVWFQSKRHQAQVSGRSDISVQVQRQEKTNVPAQGSQAGRIPPHLWEDQSFCSIQTFN